MTLPTTGEFYSFDTSAFINGRNTIFQPQAFGAIWDAISRLIEDGEVRAVDPVKWELAKKSDEVNAWAKAQKRLFVPLREPIQRHTKAVLAAHPLLIKDHGGNRSGADPFVIALAMEHDGIVVTEEEKKGSLKKPHIPDVCDDLGVRWMPLTDFVVHRGWTVTLTN